MTRLPFEKETKTFRHRLCLWLDHIDNPSRGNMVICDRQWTSAMDEAVALATAAAEGRLSANQAIILHAQFIKFLPKINDPEFLSDSACQYYLAHKPPLKGPWNARDISDFILARAHRLYNHANALERWFSSRFKSNPVGLP